METGKMAEAFLKPETYDEKVSGKIDMLQTHISWVFLTGSHAYKVKKPVNFGFLDFTTLEKRKRFCQLELELNRRLSPEIYLDVLPVTEKKSGIKINGTGNIVEYALKMRQLPQEMLMNRLLDRKAVDEKTIGKIARAIADFHLKAETSKEIASYGSPENILFNWEENFRQTEEFVPEVMPMGDFAFAEKKVKGFIKNNAELFRKRMEEGKIRRIHGDLHSGNIFIVGGKPQIFDCIEFNDRFSCMDVLADVAFLSMDLDYKGDEKLSAFLVKKYGEKSMDNDMQRLLGFYKCYYAWVRGKVTAFRLKERLPADEKGRITETSKKYFRLALDCLKKL